MRNHFVPVTNMEMSFCPFEMYSLRTNENEFSTWKQLY